jgi:radical SAM superfamily enzyme YgiQ (UPF0313 family)
MLKLTHNPEGSIGGSAAIVLATLNAKYIHAAFGLRYLAANLGPLRNRARILEFDIAQRPLDIAEALLRGEPRVIGLGVYIWNIAPTTHVVDIIKRVSPNTLVVLGGPEVSYEWEQLPIVSAADVLITGEADLEFGRLCHDMFAGGSLPRKVIHAAPPDLAQVAFPYSEYTPEDLSQRLTYVEASRSCPFECEFCLSSLDVPVRQFPLEAFLAQLDGLLAHGATHLKFVDRTFNLNLRVSGAILESLLQRWKTGCFYHFEAVPDRLPAELRALIGRFPPGSIQLEVGIQTFDQEVAARIKRRQNCQITSDNLRFLREHTGAHLHTDLIVGLPGESVESFAAGFDRLVQLRPHEIQVGILKKLRGTPIGRHDAEWDMVYSPHPPYEILRNTLIDFATMQKLRRFARYWDLVGNSGNFVETTPLIWSSPNGGPRQSPFHSFMGFSEWLFGRAGKTDSIALPRLVSFLFEFLRRIGHEPRELAERMLRDYRRANRPELPECLRPYLPPEVIAQRQGPTTGGASGVPKRQARHLSLYR